MNDDILENKLELKDLSRIIGNHLTISNHTSEKVNKINQGMGLISGFFVFLDKQNFHLPHKTLIRPHIEYGNIV